MGRGGGTHLTHNRPDGVAGVGEVLFDEMQDGFVADGGPSVRNRTRWAPPRLSACASDVGVWVRSRLLADDANAPTCPLRLSWLAF
jgi:hypothetical protein